MTRAVCLNCGEFKFGAFNECQNCGYRPDNPEQQAKHLLVTDHYRSPEELDQISKKVKAGEPLVFDPAAVEEAARAAAVLLPQDGGHARRWLLVLAVIVVVVVVVIIATR
jgi:hypothetical protein